jgi:hypothetical protein
MRLYRLRHTLAEAVLFFIRTTLIELQYALHKSVIGEMAFIQQQLEIAIKATRDLRKDDDDDDVNLYPSNTP